MEIKVISFDLFQTLVDVNARIKQIWKGILGLSYTNDKAIAGAQAVLEQLKPVFDQAMSSNKFWSMERVYLECAKRVIESQKLDTTPHTIVNHLLYQHSQAPVYPDVMPCIEKLQQKYQLVISSDSNHMMVDDLLPKLKIPTCFISEDLKSYKASKDGLFFQSVIKTLKVSPDQILHIGDSATDIIGANAAGIHSCWLNRNQQKWMYEFKPEYTISSLSELPKLLN